MSIPFLDLKSINLRFKEAFLEASNRVLDSGWFILGHETEMFESEFSAYCESDHCIGVGNGLDIIWYDYNFNSCRIIFCKVNARLHRRTKREI